MKKIGFLVSLEDLYQNNSISSICSLLSTKQRILAKENIPEAEAPIKSSDSFCQRHEPPSTFPLSHAQQRGLLHDISMQDATAVCNGTSTVAYNVQICIKLIGSTNISVLMKSLELIYNRHSILRSCILNSDDGKNRYQIVFPSSEIPLQISTECSDVSSIMAKLQYEASIPFSLQKDSKMRCKIFILDANDESEDQSLILSCCFHHFFFDGYVRPYFVNFQRFGLLI